MANCMLDQCDNEVKGRRYCCPDCKSSAKSRREKVVEVDSLEYREVVKNEDLLNEGAWLMFTNDHEDKKCIGDFIRMFKRPPAHLIPTTQGKFVGPVTTNEELARRWGRADQGGR